MTAPFTWKKHIPIVMTVVAALTMFGLCGWQVQRLQWKGELIEKFESAKSLKAKETLPTLKDGESWGDIEFQRFKVRGTIVQPVQEFHVGPRYYINKLGYHIHTTATLNDGRHVLVNLGWVPADKKDADKRNLLPEKEQAWEVMVRVPPRPRIWTPNNRPDKNFWFYPDVDAVASHVNLPLEPVVLEVVAPPKEGIWPIPSDGQAAFKNDHLGYAITWGLIGVAVVWIYVAYRRKEKADLPL